MAGYATDEKTKSGYVRVIVGTRGLKTSSKIIRKGILPKSVKKAENADVDAIFGERSFCLTVTGTKGELKEKKFKLEIKRLPHEIDGSASYTEIEKDRVLVFLKKETDRSWYPELDNGLETAEEQEEEEENKP